MTPSSVSVSAPCRRAKGCDPLKAATHIVLFTAAVATVLAVLALAEPAHASTPVERSQWQGDVETCEPLARLQTALRTAGGIAR